jgi:D-glycero-alpha-D-manno-heptose-7-phosphate kinase
MILTRTPLRISFAGGGSDLPAYYRFEPGAVISTTIDKYIYIATKPHFDENKIRVSYSIAENVECADQVQHELVRQALLKFGIHSGMEIVSIADVTGKGTGLGSSSAYTVGLLKALGAMPAYQSYDIKELAETAFEIEAENLGKPVGKQDQYAAAYGGFNLFRFEHVEAYVSALFPPKTTLQALESRLGLFWTGITRSADSVLAEQQYNTNANAETRAEIKAMVYLAEQIKYALMDDRPDDVGLAMRDGWLRKRRLANSISTQAIERWIEKAQEAGALGAKLCGAGGGGFLLVYMAEGKQEDVREAMRKSDLKELPFGFSKKGAEVVYET